MITMNNKNKILTHRNWKYALGTVLVLGVVLRVVVWYQQRSFFLDEANLLRNFVEKSYTQLFGHLDYAQYAPPLFSIFAKASIQFFGVNELSSRLFPLICGIALLFVFYGLSKRFLSSFALFLALFFLSFDQIFIDYATECKQYSSDVLCAMCLLYLTQVIDYQKFNNKNTVLWLLVGSISIWFSMSSIFILAGVGVYYLFYFIKEKNNAALLRLIGVGCFWLFQFVCYFVLILKTDTQDSNLQFYHREFFFAFPPHNLAEFRILGNQIEGIITSIFGKSVVAAILFAIGFCAGLWQFWNKNKAHFLLFSVPILLTLLASSLHYYSIIARLTLFFLPILILIVFYGFDFLFQKIHFGFSTLILLLWLPVMGMEQQLSAFYTPFRNYYAALSDGMAFIQQEKQANEMIFVHKSAQPVAYLYQCLHQKPYHFSPIIFQEYRCCVAEENTLEDLRLLKEKGTKRIWMVYDQPDFNFILTFIQQQNGHIIKQFNFYKGSAFLIEF
jgi:hypothetical protein